MMKKINFISAIIAMAMVVSLCRIANFQKNQNAAYYELVDNFVIREGYSRNCEKLVRVVVKTLAKVHPEFENVVINKIPDSGGISIILVNLNTNEISTELQGFMSLCKNNIVSVGSRYIVVDEDVVKLLCVFVYNDMIGMINSDIFNQLEGNQTELQKRKHKISYNQSQLHNLDAMAIYLKKFGNIDLGYIDELYSAITLMMGDCKEDMDFGFFVPIFTSAIAPLLLHEMGHISQNSVGCLIDPRKVVDKSVAAALKESEQAADDYALERLRRQILVQKSMYTFGRHKLSAEAGLVYIVRFLKMMQFSNRMFGFRGMPMPMLGCQFAYREPIVCLEHDKNVLSSENISDVREVLLPLLTEDEWKMISGNSTNIMRTHVDSFIRGMLFDELSVGTYPDTAYDSAVRAILSFDDIGFGLDDLRESYRLDILRIYPGKFAHGVRVPNDMYNFLKDFAFERKAVAACPFEDCEIFTSDNGVVIELGFNKHRIVYMTGYLPHLTRYVVGKDGNLGSPSDDSISDLSAKILVMAYLVTKIGGVNTNKDIARFKKYLDMHFVCTACSFVNSTKVGTIHVAPYDKFRSVFLTFVAK